MPLLDDGLSTSITFGTSTITFYEETEVTPPGFSGGGKKNVTTLRNIRARTYRPKLLLDVTDTSKTVRYDPAIYPQIKEAMQVNQEITTTFPDGSTLVFWGWIEEFQPNALVEGEPPTAEVTICASNIDETDGSEVFPVYTAAS